VSSSHELSAPAVLEWNIAESAYRSLEHDRHVVIRLAMMTGPWVRLHLYNCSLGADSPGEHLFCVK